MRLLLKINGTEFEAQVDNGQNAIVLNYNFDALSSPATYFSEFTYTFKLPMTAVNNKMFSEFVQRDYAYTSPTAYNPTIVMDYTLLGDRGETISEGKAKLSNFDQNYYYIQFNGALGCAFRNYLNSGFDTLNDDENYTLFDDPLKENNTTERIDRSLVYASWKIDSAVIPFDMTGRYGTTRALYGLSGDNKVNEHDCWSASFVSFIPENQGRYSDFDSDKWVYRLNASATSIMPIFTTGAEDEEEIDVGDGLADYQMRQMRSYYMQPAVYVQKLWEIYRQNSSSMTGYTLDLDSRWYNADNPLLRDVVYTLPQLEPKDYSTVVQATTTSSTTVNAVLPTNASFDLDDGTVAGLTDIHPWLTSDSKTIGAGQVLESVVEVPLSMHSSGQPVVYPRYFPNPDQSVNTDPQYAVWNYENPLMAVPQVLDANNNVIQTGKAFMVVPVPEGDDVPDYPDLWKNTFNIIAYYFTPNNSIGYSLHPTTVQDVNFGKFQLSYKYAPNTSGTYKIKWNFQYANNKEPMYIWRQGYSATPTSGGPDGAGYTGTGASTQRASLRMGYSDTLYSKTTVYEGNRSTSPLTMERLFGTVSPFTVLLKYSKMMGLFWIVDDWNRKIKVMRRDDFFYDCMTGAWNINGGSMIPSYEGFLPMDDKIDVSQGYEVIPLAYDGHRVDWTYKENDEKYHKMYKEKYGREYGSKVMYTADKSNSNTIEVFEQNDYDSLVAGLMSTSFYRTRDSYKYKNNMQFESEPLVSNITDDGEQAKISGQFYFRNGVGTWEDNEFGGVMNITDDSPVERQENAYAYQCDAVLESNSYAVTVKPLYDIKDRTGVYALNFAESRENYTPEDYSNLQWVYDSQWANYTSDAYNKENRLYKYKAYLPESWYNRLKINPLVSLQNCIYLVQKIEYDLTTKKANLTLRQILSIKKLTNNRI